MWGWFGGSTYCSLTPRLSNVVHCRYCKGIDRIDNSAHIHCALKEINCYQLLKVDTKMQNFDISIVFPEKKICNIYFSKYFINSVKVVGWVTLSCVEFVYLLHFCIFCSSYVWRWYCSISKPEWLVSHCAKSNKFNSGWHKVPWGAPVRAYFSFGEFPLICRFHFMIRSLHCPMKLQICHIKTPAEIN